MEEVVKLLAPINTTKLETHGEGTDISPWMQAGVPGQFNVYNKNTEAVLLLFCTHTFFGSG